MGGVPLSVHRLPACVICQHDPYLPLFQSFAKISYLLVLLLYPIFSTDMGFFTFQLLYDDHWNFNGTFYEMLGR